MIRLKYILLESKQIPNVLFVSDNGVDKSKGYARKLISNGIVTGEIYTANAQPADELVPLVYYNLASGYYDAVVIHCSGLYDDNEENIIEKFQLIADICKRKQIEPIFITMPTDRFVRDEKYTSINTDRINNWIETNTTYVDLSKINDDIYFTDNGKRLSKLGNSLIYERLKRIFQSYKEETEELPVTTKTDTKELRKVQRMLIKLGYNIDPRDLKQDNLGKSTEKAIEEFQLKNSLSPNGELNKKTLTKLFSIGAIAAVSDADELDKQIKTRAKSVGEHTDAMQVMQFLIDKGLSVAGAAGIAGNMEVESQFKTNAIGDKGTSIGLVQWHNDRKNALFSWCEEKKLDPLSYEGQMSFLWFELETKFKSLTTYLETTEDPRAAALEFAKKFERPAVISSKRIEHAEEFFNEYNESGGPIGTLKSIWNNVKTVAAVGAIMAAGSSAAGDDSVGRAYFGEGSGKLPGATGGGLDGDWGGSLPKLISILPAGTWIGEHKRARKNTKDGGVSDHYLGRQDSYAVDFMLDKTFKGDKTAATNFAIALAQNAGKNITSWKPYVNSYLNIFTPDGYRVQIIWLSMVGGNHYDHVHVGVRQANKN
jgi:hypothetical protein